MRNWPTSRGAIRNLRLRRMGGRPGDILPTRKWRGNSVFPGLISGSLTLIFLILTSEKPPAGVHVVVATYLCTLTCFRLFGPASAGWGREGVMIAGGG